MSPPDLDFGCILQAQVGPPVSVAPVMMDTGFNLSIFESAHFRKFILNDGT